ncbi:MAG: hybrid sensor histidine kinase/response regulator [Nitrospinae bacterium]|nr:hybrid sensor histidine kinase/response regulator [Nitrospinota bacterium]
MLVENVSSAFSGQPPPATRTILIVDDEREISALLVRVLDKQGHKAISSADGSEAFELVKKGGVDLLITDLKMPGMSGIELIRAVRQINKELEIIVITGFGSMEIFIDAIREGASDFIVKPIDRDQFLHAVNRALEKKSLSESLLTRTQQLLQAEKMATVGVLSTGIAHEINNPTTFIRTNLQLMREYIKRLAPRMENLNDPKNQDSLRNILLKEFPEMIDEALKGTDRVQKIVAGIKHYAHMSDEGGGENVDIREVITQAVNLVRAKLRKNITITENYLNIKEIKGHFSKLEQVFVNLLVNAGDAINDKIMQRRSIGDNDFMGIIDVSATIIDGDEADGVKSPEYLILTFYDNGKGISDEKLSRVFDPFFTTKPVGVGTGLGLYICYEIIKQHGGEITVQSEEGEGTAFIIKLPVEGAAPKGRG